MSTSSIVLLDGTCVDVIDGLIVDDFCAEELEGAAGTRATAPEQRMQEQEMTHLVQVHQ